MAVASCTEYNRTAPTSLLAALAASPPKQGPDDRSNQAHQTIRRPDRGAEPHLTVQPGRVTGFLGPNGAGKSTTMRMILGLDAPTSGTVTVEGKPYAQHDKPLQALGTLFAARVAIHTSWSARNHLLALAATHGVARRRMG